MCVAEAIKEVRIQKKMTHEDMALLTGVGRSTYGAYERKERPIPNDVVMTIADKLNSPQIVAEYAYEHRTEFFNTPVLNNVDTHPQVILDVLIEEGSEMIKAATVIKQLIKNKHNKEQLSNSDLNELVRQEEQIADLFTVLKMHFIVMEQFGIKVKDIEKRCNTKLKQKGYIKREKARYV